MALGQQGASSAPGMAEDTQLRYGTLSIEVAVLLRYHVFEVMPNGMIQSTNAVVRRTVAKITHLTQDGAFIIERSGFATSISAWLHSRLSVLPF